MIDMYQENILEHYKNPQNFGRIAKPTVLHKEYNPICGDEITVHLLVENNYVKEIKFMGSGCAISMAAMSILSEEIKHKSFDEIKKISREDVVALLGIPIGPVRLKCALLGLKAVVKAIEEFQTRQRKKI